MDIILLDDVSGGRIYHGSKHWRGATAIDEVFGLTIARPHALDVLAHCFYGTRTRTGQDRGHRVQKEIFTAQTDRLWDVAVLKC